MCELAKRLLQIKGSYPTIYAITLPVLIIRRASCLPYPAQYKIATMSIQPEGGRYSIVVPISFDIDEVPESVTKYKAEIYSDGDAFLCQVARMFLNEYLASGIRRRLR